MRIRSILPALLSATILLSSCTSQQPTPPQTTDPSTPTALTTSATAPPPTTAVVPVQPATWQLPPDYLPAMTLSRFFALPGSDRIWAVGRSCDADNTCQGFIQASADPFQGIRMGTLGTVVSVLAPSQ